LKKDLDSFIDQRTSTQFERRAPLKERHITTNTNPYAINLKSKTTAGGAKHRIKSKRPKYQNENMAQEKNRTPKRRRSGYKNGQKSLTPNSRLYPGKNGANKSDNKSNKSIKSIKSVKRTKTPRRTKPLTPKENKAEKRRREEERLRLEEEERLRAEEERLMYEEQMRIERERRIMKMQNLSNILDLKFQEKTFIGIKLGLKGIKCNAREMAIQENFAD
jgi:hypothetical protein